MATRIGSLEEFEITEVGGTHQGVSSKMLIYYLNFCGHVGIFRVWGRREDVLFCRFTMHFVQDLIVNLLVS